MLLLKHAVGYFNWKILLNVGTSSNFHMNNFTVLRLIDTLGPTAIWAVTSR